MSKIALITGATHGIGLALTKNLLKDGWAVFGIGRDKDSLDGISSDFSSFIPICADLTKNDDIKRIAERVKGSKLQLLIHNAGMKTPPRNLEEHSCEAIDDVIAVNLSAPMKLNALLTQYMPSGSRMLFVTSRAATLKLKQSSTYCATKAALDEVAAIVRKELSEKNIGVASVIPGEVDTKIQQILRETHGFHLHRMFQQAHDSGQLIKPEVCADFLKWLLCDLPFEQFNNSQTPFTIYDKSHHKHWLKPSEILPEFPFNEDTQTVPLLRSKL